MSKTTKKGKLPKIPKGHQPHKSGSGQHKHKNDRRNSRADAKRKAVSDE